MQRSSIKHDKRGWVSLIVKVPSGYENVILRIYIFFLFLMILIMFCMCTSLYFYPYKKISLYRQSNSTVFNLYNKMYFKAESERNLLIDVEHIIVKSHTIS